MSVAYISAVLDHTPDLTPAQAMVMLVLGNSADDDSRRAFALIGTIARRTRMAERTVYLHLDALERNGYLRIHRRPGRSSVYELLIDLAGNRLTPDEWAALDAEKRDSLVVGTPEKSAPLQNPQGGTPAKSAAPPAKSAPIDVSKTSSKTKTRARARPDPERATRTRAGNANPDVDEKTGVWLGERAQPTEKLTHVQELLKRARARRAADDDGREAAA